MNAPSQDWSRLENSTGERAFLEREGPWHLVADWVQPVFIHFRIDPDVLQSHVPFELDRFDGSAWVSLVAFTMRGMRPAIGGGCSRWLFVPFREQRFLNVRTYVRHEGESGIHFIAEWISDWLNSKLGPRFYGLPYRHGHLSYHRSGDAVNGVVRRNDEKLLFRGAAYGPRGACQNARDTFLLERYAAFNSAEGRKRYFRVWHAPWERQTAEIEILCDSLMRKSFNWWEHATLDSTHVSDGAFEVRMSRPRKVRPISPSRPDGVSGP